MFAELLQRARTQLARLRRRSTGRTQAIRDWYRDFGCAHERRESRGIKLLKEWLSAEQLAQFETHSYFDVTGCHTGRRYRIRHGTATNVYELDGAGRPRTGWCFVPKDYLVAGDVMLAQKIALETDERAALAVAKKFTR